MATESSGIRKNSLESGDSILRRGKPFAERIADALRKDILFGRLKPGEPIRQSELTERFGTSRMPVRVALRQLTYEGFLLEEGNHRTLIASLSRSDLEGIYLIEGILHALAVRRVTEEGSQDNTGELTALHRRMVKAEEERSVSQMARINWDFHRRINKMANSPKLLAVLRTHSLAIRATTSSRSQSGSTARTSNMARSWKRFSRDTPKRPRTSRGTSSTPG